jgi:hypothetical protein
VCDLSSQERSSLSVTEETIKSLQNELKRSNALCRQAEELCHKWTDQQKALKQQGISFDMETYIKHKSARVRRSRLYQEASRVRQQLKDERSKKYWMLQPEVNAGL